MLIHLIINLIDMDSSSHHLNSGHSSARSSATWDLEDAALQFNKVFRQAQNDIRQAQNDIRQNQNGIQQTQNNNGVLNSLLWRVGEAKGVYVLQILTTKNVVYNEKLLVH